MKGLRIFYAAEGLGGGGEGKPEYIEVKDPVDGTPVMVPKNLEGFIGKVAKYARKAGEAKKQEEIDALKEKIEDYEVELTEAKKKTGSVPKEIENIKAEYEKSIKALTEKIAETEKSVDLYKNKFYDTKISNDLFSVLPANDLHNPAQTMDLLRQKGNARLVEKTDMATGRGTGEFETVLTLKIKDAAGNLKDVDFSPKDAIAQFLAMDENSFHLKNKLAPGGGGGRQPGNGQGVPVPGDLNAQLADAVKRKDLAAQVAIEEQMFEKQTGVKL